MSNLLHRLESVIVHRAGRETDFLADCAAINEAVELLIECERVLAFYASARVSTPTPGAAWQNCDDGRYASATLAKLRGEQ